MYRRIILSFILPFCLLIFLFSVIAETAVQALNVSGPITTDTTWTAVNSPYVISDKIDIEAGVTLTIEAGVTVLIDGNGYAALLVKEGAHLEAVGTEVNPIIFTSVANNGPGDWTSLGVTGSARFIHTEFSNSYYNLDINGATGGLIILEDSLLNDAAYGMNLEVNALHRLQMNNVQFVNNNVNLIRLDTIGSPTLSDSATLSFQPGLEGYSLLQSGLTSSNLTIPENVTLTVEAGVTLFHDWLYVEGNLEAIGTVVSPTKFVGKTEPVGIVVEEMGSLLFENAQISNGDMGIGIVGNSAKPVVIRDSAVISKEHPVIVSPMNWHRLQMENLTFNSNIYNGVLVDVPDGNELADNVHLTNETGMEGYFLKGCAGNMIACGILTVPNGLTLTLEAGIQFIADEDVEIQVGGYLNASGSQTQSIKMTSNSGEFWEGIRVAGGGDVQLNHVAIENAQIGMAVEGGTVTAVCTQFRNNQTAGIQVPESVSPTISISQSVFEGNGVGVWNLGDTAVSAINNWWGSTAGPQTGTDVIGDVTVDPWLLWEPDCISPVYDIYLPLVIRP